MKTLNKKERLWKRIVKATTCHLTIFTLITSPTLLAQEESNPMARIQGFIQGVGGFATDLIQQQQARQQQAQMAQMMASLHPQNQMVPSKMFPHCPVLKAVTDFPTGICETAPQVGDQGGVQMLMSIRDMADDFGNEINKLLAENQNSPQPIGLQCLNDAGVEVQKQIEDRINALQARINEVKKANQLFKEQNKKILEEMDTVKGDLYGGHTSIAETKKDYLANFSPSCSALFGQEGNAEAIGSGLDGLRIKSDIPNQTASRAIADESIMKARALKQLKELDKLIKRNGVGAYLDANAVQAAMSSAGNSTNFQVAGNLITNKATLFRSEIAGISESLADIGFSFSESDLTRNFQDRFEDFAANAQEFFKKEAVTKCVTGEDRTLGLGLSKDEILRSLRIKGVSDNQTSLQAFRDELSNILDSDAFIAEKMAAIRALDNKYGVGEVYVTYTNASGRQVRSTTYGLYKAQIEACENKINNDSTIMSRSSSRGNKSYQHRIDQAAEAIKKAVQLEKDYRVDLRKSLYDRIVNCEGIELREEDCTYNSITNGGGILSDNNANYCISNATMCAQRYNSCQGELDTVVENKKMEMKTLASRFNANVSGLVAQQEALLTQIKAQALTDANYLREYFPKSTYDFPADLFVKMPQERMVNEYGVALRGKGDLSQLDDLPKQLSKLKEMLTKQKGEVNKVIAEHIQQQKSGMEKEKKRWDNLANQCRDAENHYNQAVAEQTQQMQEQQANTNNFCRRYNRIAANPAAGCGSASALAEDASNISQAVDPNAADLAEQYVRYCDSVQNEGRNSEDSNSFRQPASMESQERTPRDIYRACSAHGWDWGQVADGNNINEAMDSGMLSSFESTYDENRVASILEGEGHRKERVAELYCSSFGRELVDNSCGDADQSRINPCHYINYMAQNDYGVAGANSDTRALDEFARSMVDVESSSFHSNSFLRDVGSSYSSYIGSGTNSPSGRIGEQMSRTPCLATNDSQLGESPQNNDLNIPDSLSRWTTNQ